MYEVIVIPKSYQLWKIFGLLGPISPKTLGEESSLWVNFFVEEDHENSK